MNKLNDNTHETGPLESIGIPFVPDTQVLLDHRHYGPMPRRLFVHRDLVHVLPREDPRIRKRFSVVLQHLAAHGRTSSVKGCSDPKNAGWRRTPMQGNHMYVWWAPAGADPVKPLNLPRDSIVIQTIRHHDDHDALSIRPEDEYVELLQHDILGDRLALDPWTDAQLEFAWSSDGVRVALGRPGAGKTTALWLASQLRRGERVLYLTWSEELRDMARRHLTTFSTSDTEVTCETFSEFLSRLSGQDTPTVAPPDQMKRFEDLIAQLPHNVLGPWKDRRTALYAELRGVWLGSAVPFDRGSRRAQHAGVWHLTAEAYHECAPVLDSAARRAVQKVFNAIEPYSKFRDIFPEFVATSHAAARLRKGDALQLRDLYDRILVDEVQDLTRNEIAVLVEYVRQIALKRRRASYFLLAGDSGQTVRPTDFDWGGLNTLLGSRLARPSRTDLKTCLRCPVEIARVVARADSLYGLLLKSLKPDKQLHYEEGLPEDSHISERENGGGGVYHVVVACREEARDVLDRIAAMETLGNVAVVDPDVLSCTWLYSRDDDFVLSPAAAKGLEYDTVIVLDPGQVITKVGEIADDPFKDPIEHRRLRMAVDGLRVAISRATENLVFVDSTDDPAHEAASRELLGSPEPLDADELIKKLEDPDLPVTDRVIRRLEEARNLIDTQPRRAWVRAREAMRLIGMPDAPDRLADDDLVHQTCELVVRFICRLLVEGLPERVTREEVRQTADRLFQEPTYQSGAAVFNELWKWLDDTTQPPYSLLSAAVAFCRDTRENWLTEALGRVRHRLMQSLTNAAKNRYAAPKLGDDIVFDWLAVLRIPEKRKMVMELRGTAFDTLLSASRFDEAQKMLDAIHPRDLLRRARLREAQRRYRAAARLYEREGRIEDAVRNWRDALRWQEAHRVTGDAGQRRDLAWLIRLEQLMADYPEGLRSRLRHRELTHVSRLLRPLTHEDTWVPDLEESPMEDDIEEEEDVK